MGLLRFAGLVTAARHAETAEALRNAQSRVESISRKLEETRAEVQACRSKLEEAHRQLQQADERAAREAQRLEKLKADMERQVAREQKRTSEFPALELRLDDAERTLVAARDHLMSAEVKLDLLEGAANVLDARTRKLLAHAGS